MNRIKTRILKIQGTIDFIDFENSLAYSPEHNTMFGCINLTKKGNAQKDFKKELMREINRLPHTVSSINDVNIFLPEEIYSGPNVNLSPDIFFIVNNHKSTVEIDFSKEVFLNSPSIAMRSGGHHMDGVFIANGETFRNSEIQNISILDVAPTILALFDIEIPTEIDGRFLAESIKPEILESINVRLSKEANISDNNPGLVSKGDMKEMKGMLKSLGYM